MKFEQWMLLFQTISLVVIAAILVLRYSGPRV
jgi:hypothetical protein